MTSWHDRNRSRMRDYRQSKRDAEKLDAYGVAMSFDPVQTPEDILLERERREVVSAELIKLAPRIERVLRMRMTGYTLEDVAQSYGLTRERIRQMEHTGHRIIKRRLMEYARPEVVAAARLKTAREDKARRAAVKAEAEAEQRKWIEQNRRAVEARRQYEEEEKQRELAERDLFRRKQAKLNAEARARRIAQQDVFALRRWRDEAAGRAWAREQALAAWQAALAAPQAPQAPGAVFAPPRPKPAEPVWSERDWEAWETAWEKAHDRPRRDWLHVGTR